jgi:hypothetical protein
VVAVTAREALERKPDAMRTERLRGYVWLDTPGKVLCVPARHLEFREGED